MSQRLTIEMSDDVYEALLHAAEAQGATPSAIASSALERQFSNGAGDQPPKPQIQKLQGFRSVFGIVSLPQPVGLDNEQIDADLAREYGDSHKDR